MDELQASIKSLGIGGFIVVLLVRELFGFLRDKKENEHSEKLKTIDSEIDQLQMAFAKLSATMDNQTRILERLLDKQDKLSDEVKCALLKKA